MKKIIFILIFEVIATSLIAQTWFPLGAEWTYQTFSPSAYPYHYSTVSIKSTKDTIIAGNTASIITGNTSCSSSYNEQIFFHNSTEDVVYILIKDEFKPYFDFSKNAGESYFMYFPNFDERTIDLPYDSIEIHVDSVTTEIIDNKNIRMQHIHKSQNYYYSFGGTIIEYIGGVNGFYPESTTCDMTLFAGLHCYSDETLSYFSNPVFQTQGCDYILQVNSYEQLPKFSIYPNPAENYITVKFVNNEISDNTILEIYDIQGRKYLSKQFDSSEFIDISFLKPGYYMVKLIRKDKTIAHIKMVVAI